MELNFGATIYRRTVSERKKVPFWLRKKWLSSQKRAPNSIFSKHDYEGKNGSPLQKRASFQNYSQKAQISVECKKQKQKQKQKQKKKKKTWTWTVTIHTRV